MDAMLDEGKDGAGLEVNAEEWEQRFLGTEPARVARNRVPVPEPILQTQSTVPRAPVGYLSTLLILLQRQWKVLRADRLPRAFLRLPANLVFLLAQALAIGVMVGWVSADPGFRMFLCVVATLWFGTSNGAQQIVSELPVFRRERVSGQGINTYIQSKFAFLTAITASQAMLLFFTVIVSAAIFHPPDRGMASTKAIEKRDSSGNPIIEKGEVVMEREVTYEIEDNFEKDLEKRILANPPLDKAITDRTLIGDTGAVVADGTEEKLTAEQLEKLNSGTLTVDEPPQDLPPPVMAATPALPKSPGFFSRGILTALSRYFSLEDNILFSGSEPMLDIENNDAELLNPDGTKRIREGLPLTQVILTSLGLRLLALLLTAVVGVSMGLAISSLVQSETQAVMWVPLMLIPQILFGGFVVTLPEMSRSVRRFSPFMPSNASEKIMEVAQIFGQPTPYLSNTTKIPVFLTPKATQEKVKWWIPQMDADGRRIYVDSPVNVEDIKVKKREIIVVDNNVIQLSTYELEKGKKINVQEWRRVSPDPMAPGRFILEDRLEQGGETKWIPRVGKNGLGIAANNDIKVEDVPPINRREVVVIDGKETEISNYEWEDNKKVNVQEWNRVIPDSLVPGRYVLADPMQQDFDKTSDYNTAWQNLAVIHDQVGTHDVVEDNGKEKDMISIRNDVKYRRFDLYRDLYPAVNAMAILGGWFAACYGIVFLGLRSKQAGK